MKKLVDKLKDYLYDAADYIIVLVVIFSVGAIIGWRIPVLFTSNFAKTLDKPIEVAKEKDILESKDDTKDNADESKGNNEEANEEKKEDESSEDDSTENSEENTSEDDKITEEEKSEDENTSEENNSEEVKILTVEIPKGSLSPDIAKILYNNKLIENEREFIQTAVDLNLDTKLKYGTYKISTDSSLEEIVRQIAK